MEKLKKYGLLGGDVSFSPSPVIHGFFSNCPYALYSVGEKNLPDFLKNEAFDGLNVTVPYKKAVLPFLTGLSERARRIGSVNTIIRKPNGTLWGDNTDCVGMEELLDSFKLDLTGKRVLVLGSGGTSATACDVLRQKNAVPMVVSRSGPLDYERASSLKDIFGLVNTTPVGMNDSLEVAPIEPGAFPGLSFVADVIYSPLRTALLNRADLLGIPTRNGLKMLVSQAAEARRVFGESFPPEEKIRLAYRTLLKSRLNIVIVGQQTKAYALCEALAGETGTEHIHLTDVSDLVDLPGGKVYSAESSVIADRRSAFHLRMNGLCFHLTGEVNADSRADDQLDENASLAQLCHTVKEAYYAHLDY